MTVITNGIFKQPGEGKAYWFLGDLYTFKAVGEDTGQAYALFEFQIQPDSGAPPHVHSHESEALYIQEGEFEFQLDEETITATPGTFIHSPQGQRHSFKNLGKQPGKMLCWVTPAGMEKFFAEVGTPAKDEFALSPPVGKPDLEKLTKAAAKYGIEIIPPSSE
jgi:quercetin dioxygenase-like cupin family protein